jgi:fermentation-respiration switch protein FrsA (DUF1100 family)
MKDGGSMRWATVCMAAAGLIGVVSLWVVAGRLAVPPDSQVGAPPAWLSDVRPVSVVGAGGARLRGWFVPGGARGCVVLAHAFRKDRRAMLGRARFLREAGYCAMVYDSRAHGDSAGATSTFGHLEAQDARAVVAAVRELAPDRPIGYIGVSLGGGAAVLGETPIGVSALVLEAVYPWLEAAIANRIELYLGSWGRRLTPLLLWQVEPRLGFDPYQLNPVDRIAQIGVPLLLIAGSADRRTTLAESRQLFAKARRPKDLWVIDGAAHVDFHRHAKREYERRILEFFERYL